jgi:hypothetical protein
MISVDVQGRTDSPQKRQGFEQGHLPPHPPLAALLDYWGVWIGGFSSWSMADGCVQAARARAASIQIKDHHQSDSGMK